MIYLSTKLKITQSAYQKLRYYTELIDMEISGLGKVRENLDGLEIYDIEILEQDVSYVHSTLDTDKLAKFLNKKVQEKQNIKDYKVWWHSHVYMKADFSLIDENTINNSAEFPYLISIVTNKRNETSVRLDIYKPLRMTIPLSLEISLENDEKIKKLCQNEINTKVTKRSLRLTSKDRKKYLIPRTFKKQSLLRDLEISDHKLLLP